MFKYIFKSRLSYSDSVVISCFSICLYAKEYELAATVVIAGTLMSAMVKSIIKEC